MKPEISVIIRCKDEERFIRETLEAVYGQKTDLTFEVIIIDSGSSDRTLDIARGFEARIFEIPPGDFTFGYSLNYGAARSSGEYIICISAHCIPTNPDWMNMLVAPLRSDAGLAATFGRQEPLKGLNPFEEEMLLADFGPDGGGASPVFSNSNCAIRKALWEKHPFDEEASHSEDIIWAGGLFPEHEIRYVSAASVYHSHPLTFSFWSRRFFNSGLFEQYLKRVYGARRHTAEGGHGGEYVEGKRLSDSPARWASGLSSSVGFLLRNGYYRYIPVLPLFIFMRLYYYRKGVKEGIRLYEDTL